MAEREIEAGVALGSPEFLALTPAAQKARVASVLARASSIDTLAVPDLPKNLWGEWVPRDNVSLLHHEMLGFRVDDQYSQKTSVNGTNIQGDCIFMVQPIELHNLIVEQRNEEYNRTHGITGNGAREEIEFASTKADELPGFISKSGLEVVDGEAIKSALGGT